MKKRRIDMHPAERRVLPEIPAAIPPCLIKPPCGKQVVINIHRLRKNGPSYKLQNEKSKDNCRGIKTPVGDFTLHNVLYLGVLIGEYFYNKVCQLRVEMRSPFKGYLLYGILF